MSAYIESKGGKNDIQLVLPETVCQDSDDVLLGKKVERTNMDGTKEERRQSTKIVEDLCAKFSDKRKREVKPWDRSLYIKDINGETLFDSIKKAHTGKSNEVDPQDRTILLEEILALKEWVKKIVANAVMEIPVEIEPENAYEGLTGNKKNLTKIIDEICQKASTELGKERDIETEKMERIIALIIPERANWKYFTDRIKLSDRIRLGFTGDDPNSHRIITKVMEGAQFDARHNDAMKNMSREGWQVVRLHADNMGMMDFLKVVLQKIAGVSVFKGYDTRGNKKNPQGMHIEERSELEKIRQEATVVLDEVKVEGGKLKEYIKETILKLLKVLLLKRSVEMHRMLAEAHDTDRKSKSADGLIHGTKTLINADTAVDLLSNAGIKWEASEGYGGAFDPKRAWSTKGQAIDAKYEKLLENEKMAVSLLQYPGILEQAKNLKNESEQELKELQDLVTQITANFKERDKVEVFGTADVIAQQ